MTDHQHIFQFARSIYRPKPFRLDASDPTNLDPLPIFNLYRCPICGAEKEKPHGE